MALDSNETKKLGVRPADGELNANETVQLIRTIPLVGTDEAYILGVRALLARYDRYLANTRDLARLINPLPKFEPIESHTCGREALERAARGLRHVAERCEDDDETCTEEFARGVAWAAGWLLDILDNLTPALGGSQDKTGEGDDRG